MNQIEVMKNAVRFIEKISAFTPISYDDEGCETLKQLYQAIEQAEKVEPVATYFDKEALVIHKYIPNASALYLHPPTAPAQQPLTEKQIDFAWFKAMQGTLGTALPIHEFARAIEQAHGIKGASL